MPVRWPDGSFTGSAPVSKKASVSVAETSEASKSEESTDSDSKGAK